MRRAQRSEGEGDAGGDTSVTRGWCHPPEGTVPLGAGERGLQPGVMLMEGNRLQQEGEGWFEGWKSPSLRATSLPHLLSSSQRGDGGKTPSWWGGSTARRRNP